jgi:hypothetical protein
LLEVGAWGKWKDWKVSFFALFKNLYWNSSGDAEEDHKNIRIPCSDSNRMPTEWKRSRYGLNPVAYDSGWT